MHSTTDLATHSVFLLDQYPLLLFCDVTVVLAGSNRPEAVAWRSALEDCSWPKVSVWPSATLRPLRTATLPQLPGWPPATTSNLRLF